MVYYFVAISFLHMQISLLKDLPLIFKYGYVKLIFIAFKLTMKYYIDTFIYVYS